MKKIFLLFLIYLICFPCFAKNIKSDINDVINDSIIPKNSISVSIKDLENNKSVYELNEKILMHPASVQKMLTLPASIDVLGFDYEFKTKIFSRGSEDYLIKLAGDPYFTFSDLKSLINNVDPKTSRTIYIDDSIIEKKDWGEGWQWDDDLNTHMPRFNAYNMDNNIIKITIMADNNGENTIIINPSKYPVAFFNNVKIGEISNVNISRDNNIAPNAITLEGTVREPISLYIPINNLKRYFNIKLRQALEDRNIYLKNQYKISELQNSDKELAEINHPISTAIDDILKNSNNKTSETVMKIAGGKAYNKTGTDLDGVRLFHAYCKKLNIDTTGIRLVDASGVSKNNLVYADFITEFLIKNKDNQIFKYLPTSGEGTLANRMIPLKNSIYAKTGTLSDISGISGFLTSKKGKKYVFSIMINNPTSTESEKKTLEDYILRELWLKG